MYNDAHLSPRGDGGDQWEIIGDPTEGALLVAARKAGVDFTHSTTASLLYEIPLIGSYVSDVGVSRQGC